MSAPDSLYIRHIPEKTVNDWDPYFVIVELDSWAGEALFEYILPHMPAVAPEFADPFEGAYIGGVLTISEIPAKYWRDVYYLIMQACDEVARLTPYKAALKSALEADPRFQA